MATARTATLSLRIDPFVTEALRVLAEKEHRNIANMIEMMIRDYCSGTAGRTNGRPVVLCEFSERSASTVPAVGLSTEK